MVKSINMAFLDEEHEYMTIKKKKMAKDLGRPYITWHEFMLRMCGYEGI